MDFDLNLVIELTPHENRALALMLLFAKENLPEPPRELFSINSKLEHETLKKLESLQRTNPILLYSPLHA